MEIPFHRVLNLSLNVTIIMNLLGAPALLAILVVIVTGLKLVLQGQDLSHSIIPFRATVSMELGRSFFPFMFTMTKELHLMSDSPLVGLNYWSWTFPSL